MASPAKKDWLGQTFGKLTVVGEAPPLMVPRRRLWVACECGNRTMVQIKNLRSGDTISCGCVHRARATENLRKWQATRVKVSKLPEYKTWRRMIERCEDPKRHNWLAYGGRGIKVCTRWRRGENGMTGFECFLADMGRRPSPQHSIDRVDVHGHYEPGNCRWATEAEQQTNRQSSARRRAA